MERSPKPTIGDEVLVSGERAVIRGYDMAGNPIVEVLPKPERSVPARTVSQLGSTADRLHMLSVA